MPLTGERLAALLGRFSSLSIVVVGDFFLDKYLDCDPRLKEISLETGLEAFQVVRVRCYPGAAGTVTANLLALGVGKVFVVGFTGDDGEGYELRRGLRGLGADMTYLFVRPDLMTPTYMKPMMHEPGGTVRELNRLDIKNRRPLPDDLAAKISESVMALLPRVNAVVVSDQVQERNFGVLTDEVREKLNTLALQNPDKLFYADSRERIGEFRHFVIKPNRYEAAKAIWGKRPDGVDLNDAVTLGQELFRRSGKTVFVTVGEKGILVFCDEGAWHVPAVPVEGEVDITGAGDSVTGGIVPSLCLGAHPLEAALIGNLIASITIRKIGVTGTASREQVMEQFQRYKGAVMPRPLSGRFPLGHRKFFGREAWEEGEGRR